MRKKVAICLLAIILSVTVMFGSVAAVGNYEDDCVDYECAFAMRSPAYRGDDEGDR